MTINGLYKYVKDRLGCLLCKINAIENSNGIYSGNGNVADARTVTLLGLMNILAAGAGRELYIEIGDGVDVFSRVRIRPQELVVGFEDIDTQSLLTFDNSGITASNFVNLLEYTPTSGADTAGVPGSMCWDNDVLYVKTNTGWEFTLLSPVP